jgi:hypothetical protein
MIFNFEFLLTIFILLVIASSKFGILKWLNFKLNNFNILQYSNTLFGLSITLILGLNIKLLISILGINPMLLAINGYENLGFILLVSIVSLTVVIKTYLISLHTNKFELMTILGVIILSLCISIILYFITMKLWDIDWEFIPVSIPVTGIIYDSVHPSSIPSVNGTGQNINGGTAGGSGNANGSNGNSNGSSNTNGSNIGNLVHNTLIHYGSGNHGSGYLARAICYVSHNSDGHSGELHRVDGSTVHFDNFRAITTRNGTRHTLFYQNATTPGGSTIEVGVVTTDSRGVSH